ncbi:MAG: 50S ribosomal protein L9 [Treponema sp.]|jgi:large subunit ribosomal protein L9|nr:50S ribosomal protein L9 [Treponema sp.]
MKVILNKDLATLGEEGDVWDVARGYFRNYLFPRGIAVPYNDKTIKIFEARKDEIAARKAEKRKEAASLKEKVEALNLVLTMPAGASGKLYGAVTSQTISEELAKQGFQFERKRIELPGNSFKSVGKYKITVRLYEGAVAEVPLAVEAQAVETKAHAPAPDKNRRRRGERRTEEVVANPQPEQGYAPEAAAPAEQNAQG